MNTLTQTNEKYISFDFDGTLYDTFKDDYNWPVYEIFKEYEAQGEKLCITTLRHQNDIKRIEELFPNIPIYATNLIDKAAILTNNFPIPIKIHYDDDITCCMRLLNSSIKPIWVHNEEWNKKYRILHQI